jgi:DNA polymerase III alpha subunit
MKKFFAYIVKFFEYLPPILAILKGLNSLLSMLKDEEKQNNKDKKPMDSEHKTEGKQEEPNPEITPTKPMFDEKRLNYLENKSYFLANVGTLKEFESLSEEIKTLAPDLFKNQFPKVIKKKSAGTSPETSTEKTTKIVDEKHQQRKNELINKVTFIVNKCGTSSDFEKLSDDVRTMDPLLFKEKSKDCRF